MGTFKDLIVFRKAYSNAMNIYTISKRFPPEEKYSLTDQIRRSSRSVCANLAEGYRKRRYPAHFIAKISDSDMENTETQVWLMFARDLGYIGTDEFETFNGQCEEIGKLANHMINFPEKYTSSSN